MQVICFSGQIASGKDIAASYLKFRLRKTDGSWYTCAFGDEVKRVLAENFGTDKEAIEEWKRKEEAPPNFDMTIRKSLMWIGDGFRQIRASIWVDKLYKNWAGHDALIISDGRYLTEVASVRKRDGINIALYRPGHENEIKHPSEAELKPYIDELAAKYDKSQVVDIESPFDFFLLNDGKLNDLHNSIEETLVPMIKKKFRMEGLE